MGDFQDGEAAAIEVAYALGGFGHNAGGKDGRPGAEVVHFHTEMVLQKLPQIYGFSDEKQNKNAACFFK